MHPNAAPMHVALCPIGSPYESDTVVPFFDLNVGKVTTVFITNDQVKYNHISSFPCVV